MIHTVDFQMHSLQWSPIDFFDQFLPIVRSSPLCLHRVLLVVFVPFVSGRFDEISQIDQTHLVGTGGGILNEKAAMFDLPQRDKSARLKQDISLDISSEFQVSIDTCSCMTVSIVSLSWRNLRECCEPIVWSKLFTYGTKIDNWEDADVFELILYSNQSAWETSSVNTRIRYSFDRIYCFRAYYSRWVYLLSTHTHTHTTHRIKMRLDVLSKLQMCMNQIRIMIDGEVTQQDLYLHRTNPCFAYVKKKETTEWTRSLIKAHTESERETHTEENQHEENKLISLARLHKMIAASHNTPSFVSLGETFEWYRSN